MKKYITTILILLVFLSASAQEISNFMGRQRIISPEIGETEVTFRISAPYADSVQINGGFTPVVKMETW